MLQDPTSEVYKKIEGMESDQAIAEFLGFDSLDDWIVVDGSKQSVGHFIQQAKKTTQKTAGGSGTSNMTDEEKLKYYGA